MVNLIEVFTKTWRETKQGWYINEAGESTSLLGNPLSSRRIADPGVLELDCRKYEDFPSTKIYVDKRDFLDKAISMSWEDTAILNPASDIKSGGGVRNGSRALEEIICRRSTLLRELEMFSDRSGFYRPQLGDTEVIYSPGVAVFKDANYSYLDAPSWVNIITAAAPRRPELTPDGKYTDTSEDLMKSKIRAVFRCAILIGVSRLVLPAWGCGAFCNPAGEVARCFKEVLDEYEFKGAFEEICFAILDDHNAKRANNPEGNYLPFKRMFP